jgi:carboxylesterase type B
MDIGTKGAWHASDIALWFGTTVYSSHRPDTDEEKKMIDTLMHSWASFAKDPQNGLTKIGWPVYQSSEPRVIQLGGLNSASISFVPREEFDKYGPVGAEKQC